MGWSKLPPNNLSVDLHIRHYMYGSEIEVYLCVLLWFAKEKLFLYLAVPEKYLIFHHYVTTSRLIVQNIFFTHLHIISLKC